MPFLIKCSQCGHITPLKGWVARGCCPHCNIDKYEHCRCEECGQEFSVLRSSKNSRSYCCVNCSDKATQKGEYTPRRKREKPRGLKTCIVCHQEFPYIRSNALYCSDHCRKVLESQQRKEDYSKFKEALLAKFPSAKV